jgi:hypothetical protein
MKRKYIIIAVLFIFTGFRCKAQQVDASKITAIQALLEKYEKYNQFTLDGSSTDAGYTKQFIELFEASPAKPIFYDLAAGKGDPSECRSASQYVDLAIKNFPYGLDIDLDIDHLKIVENFTKDGVNVYIVEVTKKITGLYLIKNFYRYNNKAYYYLTERTDKPGTILISGSFDPTGYRKYAGSKSMKGLYAGLSVGFGAGVVGNQAVNNNYAYTSEFDINPSFNLELYYMLNRNIGIGSGVGISSFSSTYSLSDYYQENNTLVTDMDGDQYYPIYNISNLTETNTYNFLDIPILLKLRTGKGRTGVYFDLGAIYSIVSSTYSIEVNGSNSGRYPAYGNVELSNIPEYGFGSYNATEDGDLPAPTSAISIYFGTGMSFPLGSSGLFLKAGLQTRFVLDNMAPTEGYNNYDYYHITGEFGTIGMMQFNGQLGLSYNLSRLMK